jgi:parvulin-like peptidyl-prolyl isomerase
LFRRFPILLGLLAALFFSTLPSTRAQENPPPAAANVNGQAILLAALDTEVQRRLDGLASIGVAAPTDLNSFRLQVLDAMIDQVLIEQAAVIQNISVSETEIEAEIAVLIEIAGNRENWLAQLQTEQLSEADFKAALYAALITQKMRDLVTASTCKNVEQVHVRHILVADETTALQIKQGLISGMDFTALAAQFSLDVTTKQAGGDLGWFARGQLLQKSIEDAAFALAIGATSDPVKSDLGYHILQGLEKAADRPVDPETCFRLTENAFELWIQALRTQAQIERFI